MSFPQVAILIPIGPGDANAIRVAVLVNAVFITEPQTALVVLVTDRQDLKIDFGALVSPSQRSRVHVVINPRLPQSPGDTGGLFRGVVSGIKAIASILEGVDFVIKLDTDALPIRKYYKKIQAAIAKNTFPIAILGTVGPTCNRDHEHFDHYGNAVEQILRASGATYGSLVSTETPPRGAIREENNLATAVRKGLANGYRLGTYCQGGCYAITGEFIRASIKSNMEACANNWESLHVGEDVLMAIYAHSKGFSMHDMSLIFCSQARGLPFELSVLQSLQCGVIHSVRNNDLPESSIVKYFHPVLGDIYEALGLL
jgi:hypothetical protein